MGNGLAGQADAGAGSDKPSSWRESLRRRAWLFRTTAQTLVVANYYNDSITVFNGGYGNWSEGKRKCDLRPGKSLASPQAGRSGRRISVLGGCEGQRSRARQRMSRAFATARSMW